jgi:hypothetical protein
LKPEEAMFATASFTALASGTFIHVAIVDSLMHEFRSAHHKYTKFGVALAGFVSMTVLSTMLHAHG